MKTDGELLRAWSHHHDEEAFAEIVRRHAGVTLSAAPAVLPHAGDVDVDDIAQAAFMALARQAGKFPVDASVAGWIFTVARRTAIMALRHRRHIQQHLDSARHATPATPSEASADPRSADPARVVEHQITIEALERALAELPATYLEPILLHHREGLSRSEAAERLGLTTTAFDKRLERGRGNLRRLLRRMGITVGGATLAIALGETGMAQATESVVASTTRAVVDAATASPGPHVATKASDMAKEMHRMLRRGKAIKSVCAGVAALGLIIGASVAAVFWTSPDGADARESNLPVPPPTIPHAPPPTLADIRTAWATQAELFQTLDITTRIDIEREPDGTLARRRRERVAMRDGHFLFYQKSDINKPDSFEEYYLRDANREIVYQVKPNRFMQINPPFLPEAGHPKIFPIPGVIHYWGKRLGQRIKEDRLVLTPERRTIGAYMCQVIVDMDDAFFSYELCVAEALDYMPVRLTAWLLSDGKKHEIQRMEFKDYQQLPGGQRYAAVIEATESAHPAADPVKTWTNRMTIDALSINDPLPDGLFKIDPSPGTKIENNMEQPPPLPESTVPNEVF